MKGDSRKAGDLKMFSYFCQIQDSEIVSITGFTVEFCYVACLLTRKAIHSCCRFILSVYPKELRGTVISIVRDHYYSGSSRGKSRLPADSLEPISGIFHGRLSHASGCGSLPWS